MRFVLIDRFIEIVPGDRAVAVKTFSGDEEFFADHFPGFEVVPGTLIAEAIGQTAGWLLAYESGFRVWPFLNMIDGLKLRRFVRPGELIRLEAKIQASRELDFEVKGEATVDGRRIADGRFLFHAFPKGVPPDSTSPDRFTDWTRATSAKLFEGVAASGGVGG
jgi:3-hydroxyacyl-[acyl-carrier-protein] dehydratase